MLKQGKHLRWLGIDMHARWRRRIAVVATYIAFTIVVQIVANGGIWGYQLFTVLVLTTMVHLLGVFSPFGPAKPFAEAELKNSFASRYIMVSGLDELARYRYDVATYDAATQEQQSDLLQTYHVGLRLYPRKPSLEGQYGLAEKYWLDEREKIESIEAERWARRMLITMIAVLMAHYTDHRHHHTSPAPGQVGGDFLLLGILAGTLHVARVLWTEPDPRKLEGEMELVRKEA